MNATDTFLNQQNIKNYRKLLDTTIDQDQRRVVLELLADEEGKLRQSEPPPYLHPAPVDASAIDPHCPWPTSPAGSRRLYRSFLYKCTTC